MEQFSLKLNKEMVREEENDEQYVESYIKAKFVFDKQIESFILQVFEKKKEENLKVSLSIEDVDEDVKGIKQTDIVVILAGKIDAVSDFFGFLLDKIIHHFEGLKLQEKGIQILIPNNYVIHIIGAQGKIIKRIISQSGGAVIIINSDKQEEINLKDCVVQIIGDIQKQTSATRLILLKLE